MKIAVLGTRGLPDVQGGIEKHCENLYPYLVAKGCNVTVLARKPYVGGVEQTYKGIKIVPLACPRNKFLETFVHTFYGIIQARKYSPDILHIHAIGPSLFSPLARLLGYKVVITHHGPDYQRAKWGWFAKFILACGERAGMNCANKVIAISETIVDHIKTKYKKNACCIPNGVLLPRSVESTDVLENFGIKPRKYILCVGRFVPEKGFHDAIKAFAMADIPEYQLVIAGDADHKDRYSQKLKKSAAQTKGVILTGFLNLEQLAQLYTHAGLFLLPSYYEGLPIALLEALSYGLSCIVSDIPAHQEVELSNDRYFKPGDATELACILIEFINREFEDHERKAQQEVIMKKYDWDSIANRTMSIYQSI